MAENCLQVHCPCCGSSFDLELAWQGEDGRRFVAILANFPPVVVRPFYRYLTLFKPAQQALRWSTVLKIAGELAPLIKAAQIRRNGTLYTVTPNQWAEAMLFLVDTPPKSLVLPLKKNAYLLSMLANQAEQSLAQAESSNEARKAGGYREKPESLSLEQVKELESQHTALPPTPPNSEVRKKSKMPEDFIKNLKNLMEK